jgi:hypothetical protein
VGPALIQGKNQSKANVSFSSGLTAFIFALAARWLLF